MESKYPECEKLHAVHEESQKIGEFLGWLKGKAVLAEWVENEDTDTNEYLPDILIPLYQYRGDLGTERLLAEYFNIDMDKVEAERQQILDSFRNQNT